MNPITHFLISWNISALSACPVRSEHKEGNELRQGVISNTVNTSNGVKMHQCLDTAAEKRDRILITLGGMLSDIDGLGIIVDIVFPTSHQWYYYHEYHHKVTHNITAAIIGMLAILLLAKRRLVTAFLFLMVFHLHLLCDLIGARGPRESDIWSIPYLIPFNPVLNLSWKYQWELNGWQNFVIIIVMCGMVFILAWKKGFSPLEILSANADKLFIQTIRKYKHEQ